MTIETNNKSKYLISKINDIFESFRQDISNGRPLRLDLGPKHSYIEFPGKSDKGSYRFAVMIRVLSIIRDNLISSNIVTKRDIYYQDVKLFHHQATVDNMINLIADHFNVERADLNIIASPKGLIHGNLRLYQMKDRKTRIIEYDIDQGPFIIPDMTNISTVQICPKGSHIPKYILVLEKEAIFQDLYKVLANNCILITGKGFPDLNTLLMLQALSKSNPCLPIYGLVDSDPYGFQIMATYKFGSKSNPSFPLIPSIKHAGSKILDLLDDCIPLTKQDRRMAMSIMKKTWIQNDELVDWKNEIQLGLFMGIKAEINTLSNESLLEYIDSLEFSA